LVTKKKTRERGTHGIEVRKDVSMTLGKSVKNREKCYGRSGWGRGLGQIQKKGWKLDGQRRPGLKVVVVDARE